jgi:Hemerythrin HHE cation binding domain
MSKLFDTIRESHDIQRSLCRQLMRSKGESPVRESLFLQLKCELDAHAAAEERFLYVPLLLTDGGLSASRHALSEHHEIEELLEELSVRDKQGQTWLGKAKQLSEKVHHHLKEEESKFFKVGGRILSDTTKDALARRYQKDLVRMRKHYADEFQTITVGAQGTVKAVTAPTARAPRPRQPRRA